MEYWRSAVTISHVENTKYTINILTKNPKVLQIITDLKIDTLNDYYKDDFSFFIVDIMNQNDYQKVSDLGFCYYILYNGIKNYEDSPQVFTFSERSYVEGTKQDYEHTLKTILELSERNPEANKNRKSRMPKTHDYYNLNFILK